MHDPARSEHSVESSLLYSGRRAQFGPLWRPIEDAQRASHEASPSAGELLYESPNNNNLAHMLLTKLCIALLRGLYLAALTLEVQSELEPVERCPEGFVVCRRRYIRIKYLSFIKPFYRYNNSSISPWFHSLVVRLTP